MAKKELLKKHRFAIDCAVRYYVKNQPTGLSDEEYDRLEAEALADGISIRDIAISRIRGNRIKNQYIESVPKKYVENSMFDGLAQVADELDLPYQYIIVEPKYDGSGIACYYEDGMPVSVVTCGGSNKSSDEGGIDQTDKLLKYFPILDEDIKAIQCEVLVPADSCDRPRQICNGLLNSKNKYSEEDIDNMICIRAFRYFSDEPRDFYNTMTSIPVTTNRFGMCNFAPGYVMTLDELLRCGRDVVDQEFIETPTGKFLIDGYVLYNIDGSLIGAVKFKNAGGQEAVEVDYIQWNDLSATKDGFSSNVMLKEGIDIRGSIIKKPSSNGVNNLLKHNITPGAMVSVTLRGSTIPCVDKVFKPGNGDFNWPVCKCGTQLGPDNIFGNNIKCPNLMCSSRIDRMRTYINNGRFSFKDPKSYNGFFIIDRIKLEDKIADPEWFGNEMKMTILENRGIDALENLFLQHVALTPLQKRNLKLVVGPAYQVLSEIANQTKV